MASAMEIKQKNRKNVLRVIYDEKKISKAEISKRLGLSMPTIAQNLSELFDKELICIMVHLILQEDVRQRQSDLMQMPDMQSELI